MGLEEELGHFIGTTQYHLSNTGLLYTDGVKYLADRARCYWLIDLVGSYQPRVRDVGFQLWRVEVLGDESGLVTMVEDEGLPPRVEQRVPYVDFPLRRFSFYCVDNVMMLKSEY